MKNVDNFTESLIRDMKARETVKGLGKTNLRNIEGVIHVLSNHLEDCKGKTLHHEYIDNLKNAISCLSAIKASN